jgi:PIN domain nuclease of toxin-antitoxin system
MYLDTHVVVWLYAGEVSRFSKKALAAIEEEDLFISPVVVLELQYLNEINRITAAAPLIVETLAASIGLTVADTPFREVVMEALSGYVHLTV